MSLYPDWMITQKVIIEPYEPEAKRPGVISYGVSSFGYDVRVGRKFKVMRTDPYIHTEGIEIDPKNFNPKLFNEIEADSILIPPNSFALAETVEYLEIPRDVLAVCVGKSTYARCGIIVNVTPLEPDWRGKITIEISNTTPVPARIYANEGIAQILFINGMARCSISYQDKQGKYQDQTGLTYPIVDG